MTSLGSTEGLAPGQCACACDCVIVWQLDRTAITATSGYGVRYLAVYLARPDGHFYCQSAQQPLTPGLSGVGQAGLA